MKGLIAGSWYKRVPNYSYNENVLLMLTLFTHLCPTSGEGKIMTSFAFGAYPFTQSNTVYLSNTYY